jgi:DNA-binding transcriptional ArsR family regulator
MRDWDDAPSARGDSVNELDPLGLLEEQESASVGRGEESEEEDNNQAARNAFENSGPRRPVNPNSTESVEEGKVERIVRPQRPIPNTPATESETETETGLDDSGGEYVEEVEPSLEESEDSEENVIDDIFTADAPSASTPVIEDSPLETIRESVGETIESDQTDEEKGEVDYEVIEESQDNGFSDDEIIEQPDSADNVVWVEAGTAMPEVGSEVNDEDDSELELDDELEEVSSAQSEAKNGRGKSATKNTGKKKSSKKNALGGIRLTNRDKHILEFLGRYRYATVAQLARRFDTSEKTLRNRLPKLREGGLVDSVFIVHARPSVWLVTSAGLKMIGMNLTAPSIKWGQVRHTMLLVELGITFEMSDENVLTEREIRAAATRYSPTPRMKASVDFYKSMQQLEEFEEESDVDTRVTSALTVPVHGRGIGHIPDMVLAREPFPSGVSGSIAIELELTRKNLGEWRTVLSAFRDSNRFAEVYYFVTSREVSKAMTRVVKALGAEDKIFIRMFEPEDDTARMFIGQDD